jgi:hypothetical protein
MVVMGLSALMRASIACQASGSAIRVFVATVGAVHVRGGALHALVRPAVVGQVTADGFGVDRQSAGPPW